VNRILADHEATIRVEDNLPTGARFIVELPIRTVDEMQAKAEAKAAEAKAKAVEVAPAETRS